MRATSNPPLRKSGFLRPEPSRFFGRSADLDRIDASTLKEGASARLVTIVGPGGIGKTRLAMRYATTRSAQFGSVWFCDMRDARVPSEMAQTVLRALAAARGAQVDEEVALVRMLAARAGALVILDNLEHLLPSASAVVRRWVAAAPEVRFLVTSRVPLDIASERVVEIGGVEEGDAIELFVERVRSRLAEFSPGDDERSRIGEITRRLGGVPLAIELAAAHIGTEDSAALLAQFGSSVPAEAEGAVQRAFSLLEPDERELLRRCSVFRGSFSLQSIDAIATDLGGARALACELAAKNVLRVERHSPMRFSMCEGIRAFAAQSLEAVHAAALARSHAEHFAERARVIAEDPTSTLDAADEWENLKAALAFGASARRADVMLHTALALDALSLGSGLGESLLERLDDALRRGAATDLGLLCRALLARSNTLYALGRLLEARRDAEAALSIAKDTGDARCMGAGHRAAAQAAFQLGELDAARVHLVHARDIERARGDAHAIATVHCQLGSLHNSLGELEDARAAFERSMQLAHGAGDVSAEAFALMGLAWNYFECGDREVAREHWARALGIVRRLNMTRSERIVTGYLGLLELDAGNLDESDELLRQAALASRRAGDLRVEGIFEGVRGAVLASRDRIAEARASFDLADELLARNAFYQGTIRIHRGHLDLAEARAATAEGHERTAAAHVANARWRLEEARALARRSDDARLAIRILSRALADA